MSSSPKQPDLQGKKISSSPTPSPSPKDYVQVRLGSESDLDDSEERSTSLVMRPLRAVLGWMTPYEQMTFLRQKRDLKRWELFRDALMRRWSNLNVICGLIMGAVSTIVFADFPLSRASFTLGIISLLSSLIAIGFGVGLIYVLGDARGSSIVMVDDRHPRLHLVALSIPEVWAFVSFGSFFADVSVIVWQADNKGWVVKAGVTAAAVALVAHLAAFGFLFREQDTTAFLIPEEPVFPSDESKTVDNRQSPSPPHSRQQSMIDEAKGKAVSLDGIPNGSGRPGFPSRSFLSSQTLVESPGAGQTSFHHIPPDRANTVPMPSTAHPPGNIEMQRSLDEFVPRPTREGAPLHPRADDNVERV